MTGERLLAEPLTANEPGRLLWALRGDIGVAEFFITEFRGRLTPGSVLHSPRTLRGKWYSQRRCEWLDGRCWSAYIDPGETDLVLAQWEKSGRKDRVVFGWLNGQYEAMMKLATEIRPRPEASTGLEQER